MDFPEIAVALRIRANELLEGNAPTALIVLGDFNDVPEAQTSLILNGPPGSKIGTEAFHTRDRGGIMLASSIWRLGFTKKGGTPGSMKGAGNCSTKSSPPRNSSRSEQTAAACFRRPTAT